MQAPVGLPIKTVLKSTQVIRADTRPRAPTPNSNSVPTSIRRCLTRRLALPLTRNGQTRPPGTNLPPQKKFYPNSNIMLLRTMLVTTPPQGIKSSTQSPNRTVPPKRSRLCPQVAAKTNLNSNKCLHTTGVSFTEGHPLTTSTLI